MLCLHDKLSAARKVRCFTSYIKNLYIIDTWYIELQSF